MAEDEHRDLACDGAGMTWPWNKRDREIDEELAYHRAMLDAESCGGASAKRSRLGNSTQIKESTRAVWGWMWLETLLQDLRFGARQLRKRPVLVIVAALSLALGIGANTAIFTVINAVLLQALPVRDPGRLVLFYDGIATGVYDGGEPRGDYFTFPFWRAVDGKVSAFEDLCAFRQGIDRVTLRMEGARETGAREQAKVHLVSGNYFRVFGVDAEQGRLLKPEDDRPNAAPVVVISHDYWSSRFNSDPHIIGKTALLNGTAFTIVGVTPREFFGERVGWAPAFWVPLSWESQILLQESWLEAKDVYWLNMVGRLRPGASRRQAESEVNLRLQEYFRARFGSHPDPVKAREMAAARIHLKPGGGGISGLRFLYSEPLHVLMGAVALVLFIACVNVAILFQARATARTQEFLARISLGASRSRIVRQVLAETVLLSVLAGLLGVAVAWGGVKGLTALIGMQGFVTIKPNALVLSFTVGISLFTGVLFGLIPAIRSSRMEPRIGAAVRSAEFGTGRFHSTRLLIAGQIALSLVLLLGAALLAHSLSALQNEDLGFQRRHILIVQTDPRLAGYKPAELLPLYQQLDIRMNTIPGVNSATLARYTPVDGTSSTSNFSIEGRTRRAGTRMMMNDLDIGPHFFETLHIPTLLGRGILDTDVPLSTPVAVINQTFANKFFAKTNPIGQHISLGEPFNAPGFEIVGVVGDSRFYDVREKPEPMAFFSAWQGKAVSAYSGSLLFSVSGNPANILPAVRSTLHGIDPRLPVVGVNTLDEQIQHSLATQKVVTELSSLFAVLALLLAAVGIYGSASYLVSRRTSEMGIRMALGARRWDVLWMVLRETVLVVLVGLVAGVPCAVGATRLIQKFLFGVGSTDPLAIGFTLLLIGAAALLAGYLPARRATAIDPMIALRYE